MRRFIIAAFLFVILVCVGSAQTEQKAEAYIFAEFGKISAKGRLEKVKEFHEALKNCDGRKGFVFNYGKPEAIKARKKALMKDWTGCDAFNCVRLIWLDVSNDLNFKTIFWIVPRGADDPKP